MVKSQYIFIFYLSLFYLVCAAPLWSPYSFLSVFLMFSIDGLFLSLLFLNFGHHSLFRKLLPAIPVFSILYFVDPVNRWINLFHAWHFVFFIMNRNLFYKFYVRSYLVRLHVSVTSVIGALLWIAYYWMSLRGKSMNFENFVDALYWTITTLTTVGYGDITPENTIEKIFTMVVMIIGVGLFGFIISKLSTIFLNRDHRKEESRRKLMKLNDLFVHYSVPSQLREHALEFYEEMTNKSASEEEQRLLGDLPLPIKEEIETYINISPLRTLDLFKGCDDDCLKAVLSDMKKEVVSPGDVIVEEGEKGDEMFLISYGRIQISKNEKTIAELRTGTCFGEMALIENTTRNADARAQSYCVLYVLSKHSFEDLSEKFPILRKNAEQFLKKRTSYNTI